MNEIENVINTVLKEDEPPLSTLVGYETKFFSGFDLKEHNLLQRTHNSHEHHKFAYRMYISVSDFVISKYVTKDTLL